jgi:hypothetical protein
LCAVPIELAAAAQDVLIACTVPFGKPLLFGASTGSDALSEQRNCKLIYVLKIANWKPR